MKFVLACYGTRGDVEPSVTLGRELLRRGHEVRIAVPPDLVSFAEAAGLSAVAYGPDLQEMLDAHRAFWARLSRNFWKVHQLNGLWREAWAPRIRCWDDMNTTLKPLADGADLLVTGLVFEEPAANIAEYHNIPLAALHYFPIRTNGSLVPFLPRLLTRTAMAANEWLTWRITKKVEDAQRRELGLPKATRPSAQRITQRGSLEVQAYDELAFPGLAAEWEQLVCRRPFVGALTVELPTETDDEVLSWIAEGPAPIFFGFGSMPVQSPNETLEMIRMVSAELGERALICAGASDFSDARADEHVKVVDVVNYATIFPACRAVVHHGGAGTTATALRAGIPQLILPTDLDQIMWGARIRRLKVGTSQRLSKVTSSSLLANLRRVIDSQYVLRARDIAAHMTTSKESVRAAADLIEDFALSNSTSS
ncbi:glycosyl transferase family 1 [Mycolicibacterium acapulense]|nr:glycosyl transferase family 1 [Mycolicibacterium acapulense]KUI10576.1 glycosyl transferase family 1 [Mycolicibacterium acapulense]KUI12568.1 glycosyl transferase family 1 [Mycolicibacterium acapulense]